MLLEERKFSFKNLKLTKATTVKVGNEAVKLKVLLKFMINAEKINGKWFIF